MTNNDERIRGVLSEDDRQFLASIDEDRGMFQQIGDSWHGPLGNWARFSFVLTIIIGLGLAYAFYRAFTADTTDVLLGWGLTCLALLIMQGFLKEWMFARMSMLSILKEVKRLQLQIAMLGDGESDGKGEG
uniref:DUF6768 family protein n=1 Tax=uncultured Altererythrobacter sp. TaxID=500840 RepID=UPI0026145334|nr:DUF6768 family protein [uncultured Altererythrobacter sp.]